MALFVVATPIGDPEDISLRAKRLLSEADVIIGEEAKVTRRFLKSIGLNPQSCIELLNEHTTEDSLNELVGLCAEKKVCLITDCGTPGFCDPGADLVRKCRERNIGVHSAPGPSSLTAFLSLAGKRIDQFVFQGFLPANTDLRKKVLKDIKSEKRPIILMDTPYRLRKLLDELCAFFPESAVTLGLELSKPREAIISGSPREVRSKLQMEKAEFILLLQNN